MKHYILLFVFLFAGSVIYAESGTLTVTSVESTPVTGITVITYDLQTNQIPAKVNETYNISVEVSFDGGISGSYILVPSLHLSGDVENVAPGTGRQITWDGGAGFPNIYSKETKVRLTATNSFICGESTVTFTYNGFQVTYGTVVGASGRCWLDRNLGASRVATSSTDDQAYGDLFQWGRFDEGHQVRANTVHYDAGLASTSVPNAGNAWDGKFITNDLSPFDWLEDQEANLWQGVNGVNNPCPPGYRLPTEAEWDAERLSWAPNNNSTGAFASPLKLPVAGYRLYSDGSLYDIRYSGYYWSSTVGGISSRNLRFDPGHAHMLSYYPRAFGLSVRCLKE